jgi:hypothetical protein
LSLEEYGRYQLVWLVSNLISVIGLFGLPLMLLSYPISSIKKWIQTHRLLFASTVLLLHSIPILYLLFNTSPLQTGEFWLIIGMVLLQHVSIIEETITIRAQQEKKLLIVNIVTNFFLLQLILGYFLLPIIYNH